MKVPRFERVLLGIGLVLLIVWGAARLQHTLASRQAIAQFRTDEASSQAPVLSPAVDPTVGSKVDYRLWDKNRIVGYEASLREKKDKPLAILRIPKIALEVPVFDGTDELTLNRGVGRIVGTARVGHPGNLGIAGHRDGFFRGLKDVGPGDTIQLELSGRTDQYVVKQIQIVKPEDTSVLGATTTPTLTLVTCFPFYYVGSAPERYIVTASIQVSGQRD